MKKNYLWPIVTLFILISSCNFLESVNETKISDEEYFFQIDSSTIINDIQNGKLDSIFSSIEMSQADILSIPENKNIDWDQEEYLLVADALNKHLLNETLDDWMFKGMDFGKDCSDDSEGFQESTLEYFKIVNNGSEDSRIKQFVEVMPGRNLIRRYDATYAPVSENWLVIDPSKVNVAATKALDIAEINGGNDIRSIYKNNCYISVSMTPGSDYPGWRVRYILNDPSSQDNKSEIFSVDIDPDNGKFNINK
jgi:hypothetical protein